MSTLLAYHNDAAIKAKYLERVEAHRKADEIIKGSYGTWNGKSSRGCAVGCTIHGDQHSKYETELGIPRILARLEDRIFEGSSTEWSQSWPGRFLAAVPIGADLSNVWAQFAFWLLVDEKDGVVKYAKTEKNISAIRAVAEAYKRNKKDKEEWLKLKKDADAEAAAYADEAAAYAAYDAYASAAASASAASAASAAYADAYAEAAAYADDADTYAEAAAASASASASAASAAYAAAYAAAYDAYASAAASAVYAAASAAAYAAYADAAAASARRNAFERQGEKLLELLANAPVLAIK